MALFGDLIPSRQSKFCEYSSLSVLVYNMIGIAAFQAGLMVSRFE